MELDQLRDQMEEEMVSRTELQRLLTKANNDLAMWKHKCETGAAALRADEVDEIKRKFNTKINELEAQLEAAQSKVSGLEKVKNRLQGELEDLTVEVERVSQKNNIYY